MHKRIGTIALAMALGAALPAFSPALADVKAGVDAWTRGDYGAAVDAWRALAEAGDPDAQFNMGQAYKLGRGVPADIDQALEWFRKSSAQGHIRAEDNYGLLLFQQNRREQAMPFLQKSAGRGEARAQYLYGTALFNGEFVPKDWVRAYAMMNRASAAGLPQASTSLAQMDMYIPAEQRQRGLALAAELAKQERATAVASILPTPEAKPAKPLKTVKAEPKPPAPFVIAAAPEEPGAPAKPTPTPAKPAPAAKPATGPWRVQLGAFSSEARAQAQWKTLSARVAALAGLQRTLDTQGGVTRLLAGPLRDQDQASAVCSAVKASGADCFPKKIS